MVCIVLVAWQMGTITWVAIGIYIFMLIWQFIFVGSANPVRMKVLEKTDARVKLMNEVQSDFDGVVKEILVQNGDGVEYDQPLMIIA